MAHVYILRCADGSYYVGSTTDLTRRLWQHNEGLGAAYTRRPGRRPVELAWSCEFRRIEDAFAAEKQIQGWSRAKRESLMRGDFELLPGLAKKNFVARADGYPPIENPDDVA
ncbi:GIY-YIG nuclease family protein [soil metagenome]